MLDKRRSIRCTTASKQLEDIRQSDGSDAEAMLEQIERDWALRFAAAALRFENLQAGVEASSVLDPRIDGGRKAPLWYANLVGRACGGRRRGPFRESSG